MTSKHWRGIALPQIFNNPVFGSSGLTLTGVKSFNTFCALLTSGLSAESKALIHELDLTNIDESLYENVRPDWLKIVVSNCVNLRSLKVSGCGFMSDEVVAEASESVHLSLRKLDVSQTQHLSNSSIVKLLCIFPGIVSLDLSHLPLVNDDVMHAVSTHCVLLGELRANFTLASDVSVYYLLSLEHLQSLSFTGCTNITDEFAKFFSSGPIAASLRELAVGKNMRLTDAVIEDLSQSPLPKTLRILDIGGCTNIKLAPSAFGVFSSFIGQTVEKLTISYPIFNNRDKRFIEDLHRFQNLERLILTDIDEQCDGDFLIRVIHSLHKLQKLALFRIPFECDSIITEMYTEKKRSAHMLIDDSFVDYISQKFKERNVSVTLRMQPESDIAEIRA